jgi:hypothetical protein
MRATTAKVFLFALALCLASAQAYATGYSIIIPSVANYPTTTIRFSASSIKVSFNDANFSATPTGGQWITNASGTYFGFTCAPSSVACMKATRGKGTYTYKLVGVALVAPATRGRFQLNWDVNPPGDVVEDVAILPEPSSILLLLGGMLMLAWLMRRKLSVARC